MDNIWDRSWSIDHLVPHLPLWEIVQDLYSTDPTQETLYRSCRLFVQIRNLPALPGRYRSWTVVLYWENIVRVETSYHAPLDDLDLSGQISSWSVWRSSCYGVESRNNLQSLALYTSCTNITWRHVRTHRCRSWPSRSMQRVNSRANRLFTALA